MILLSPAKLLGALLVTALAAPCLAAGFAVTPVRIYVGPQDRAIALSIENQNDAPLLLQAEVFHWSQDEAGVDKLEPTEDLIISPPIISLRARQKQVVRLGLLVPRDAARELTYRLMVREVPDTSRDKAEQVPVTLSLSLPVFIRGPLAQRKVDCVVSRLSGRELSAECQNTGTAYAQIRDLQVKRGEQALAQFEGAVYILPGALKSIRVPVVEGGFDQPGAAQVQLTFDGPQPHTFAVDVR